MRKLLLLILTMAAATLAAHADVTINATNFPDTNFRSYLLSEYPSGTITTSQLNARTELPLSGKSISNAKGIEYFTQLTRLDLYSNNLPTIDVSQNTKLTYLNLGHNNLTSITGLVNCTVLEQLYLQSNQLTQFSVVNHNTLRTLWVNDNPNLTKLFCYRNALTNLDVNRCTSLQSFQCFENANLTSIYGLATCTAITYLDCEDCAITNLSAVESMTNLAYLYARNNKLTSLNVANHSALIYLRVLGNTLLTTLDCYNCALTTLNVTGCTRLTELRCYNNTGLASITGLEGCTALQKLSCYSCALTDLSALNNLNNLTNVVCSLNKITQLTLTDKSNLTQLWVDDNDQLTELYCYGNTLVNFNVTGCTGLERLDCNGNSNLTDIDGLTDCTALTYFSAEYCALAGSLDMTFCPGLTDLYCYHNNLTGLNVTGLSELDLINCMQNAGLTYITGLADCTKLTYLECSDCAISSLSGLINLPKLQTIFASNNQLTTFTYRGTSSSNLKPLTQLNLDGNTSLTSINCQYCNISDLNVYDCSSLEILQCNNNKLTSLNVSSCTSLISLYCDYNQLTSLDVSACLALEDLDCSYNQLTSLRLGNLPELLDILCNRNQLTVLDISGCPNLYYVWCNHNQLTELDLSNCPDGVLSIDCRYNQISSLDVGRFTNLRQLACSNNQIVSLDVANHTEMSDLWCQFNNLTSLDASGCSALETLYASCNQLTSMNVSGCTALTKMSIYYNNIKAGKMGQMVTGLPTRNDDNWGIIYALVDQRLDDEEFAEGNVITASQVAQANGKYWDIYWYDNDAEDWVSYAGSTVLRGDVNGDGYVNVTDATVLITAVLNDNYAGINTANADMNNDGYVNISDITELINLLLTGSTFTLTTNDKPQADTGKGSSPLDSFDNKLMELERPEAFIRR